MKQNIEVQQAARNWFKYDGVFFCQLFFFSISESPIFHTSNMRTSIALTAAVAAVTVSAQNCNPSYNVPSSTECFTNCNVVSDL